MSEDVEQKINEISETVKQLKEMLFKQAIPITHLKADQACVFLSCCKNSLNKICIAYDIYPKKVLGVNYYNIDDLKRVLQ